MVGLLVVGCVKMRRKEKDISHIPHNNKKGYLVLVHKGNVEESQFQFQCTFDHPSNIYSIVINSNMVFVGGISRNS